MIRETAPSIDIWYGPEQHFHVHGRPQQWINVLGRVTGGGSGLAPQLDATIDRRPLSPISLGPDHHRLAEPGDFNVELPADDLAPGRHLLELSYGDARAEVMLVIHEPAGTAAREGSIQHADFRGLSTWDEVRERTQIVDGHWSITSDGLRTATPYYDRVLAFGDMSLREYELQTTLMVHDIRRPRPEDGGNMVIHFAVALRWPGHDIDEFQPHRKWWPLGMTAEFQLQEQPNAGRWRILGGAGFKVQTENLTPFTYGRWYRVRAEARDITAETTHYSVKLWPADAHEPDGWQITAEKPREDIPAGGGLVLGHYSDITVAEVQLRPVR